MPGHTALTRMWYCPQSTASAFVKPITACLDATNEPRVINQDVDSTERLHDRVDMFVDMLRIAHIAREAERLPTVFLEMADGALRQRIGHVGDDERRTLTRERLRGCETDAASSSCDNDDLILETHAILTLRLIGAKRLS